MGHYNVVFFFFFQAEDGIRDWSVTGVQTCALPIWVETVSAVDHGGKAAAEQRHRAAQFYSVHCGLLRPTRGKCRARVSRSEERRVGKECRCRWSAYH